MEMPDLNTTAPRDLKVSLDQIIQCIQPFAEFGVSPIENEAQVLIPQKMGDYRKIKALYDVLLKMKIESTRPQLIEEAMQRAQKEVKRLIPMRDRKAQLLVEAVLRAVGEGQ